MPTALIGSATRPYSHFGAFPLRSIPASAHSHFGAFPSAHVSTRVLTVLPNTRPRVAAVCTSALGPAGLHWAHPRLVAHIGTGTALGSPPTAHIGTGTGPPDCPHRHRECDSTAQQNVLQQRAPVATASLREYPESTSVGTPMSTLGTPRVLQGNRGH